MYSNLINYRPYSRKALDSEFFIKKLLKIENFAQKSPSIPKILHPYTHLLSWQLPQIRALRTLEPVDYIFHYICNIWKKKNKNSTAKKPVA